MEEAGGRERLGMGAPVLPGPFGEVKGRFVMPSISRMMDGGAQTVNSVFEVGVMVMSSDPGDGAVGGRVTSPNRGGSQAPSSDSLSP